jgi:EmrB/QacA subfamily drug resistance transporter
MQATRTRSRWLTLAAVVFAVFVTALDNTVVNVALPSIQRDLHLGLSGLTWIVNGYVLSFAVLLLTGGRVADTWGRRRAFLTGLALFTATSALAGLAPGAGLLIAARALQGVGAALMTPATLAIISDVFPDERERATAVGIWAAVGALGFALGPLVGGLIAESVDWSWIFFVNVPIGIVGLVLGARLIPESKDPDATDRFDIAGLSVISGALFSLTYALIKANDYGWGSPVILALFAAAIAGFFAFVRVERRAAAPMVDLDLFRIREFSGANVVTMIVQLATFGVLLYLSLYLQNVLHYSPVRAGATLLPWIGMVIVLAPFAPKFAEWIGVRWLVTLGVALMGVAMLMFAGLGQHSGFAATLPALILGGIGGALTTPLSNVAIGAVPTEKAGVGSGVHNTFRETGGSFGVAIIGAVFAAAQTHALTHGSTATSAFVSGYSTGLRVAALIVFAGAALAAWMLRGTCDDPKREPVGMPEPLPVAA